MIITDEDVFISSKDVDKLSPPIEENNGNESIFVIFIVSSGNEYVKTFDTQKEADSVYRLYRKAVNLYR